jgi:glycosyltransferase involved in cell wall biosynthesis
VLTDITPLILTYNEAPNIARTLERLHWARDIVVVDSFSDDETLDIVRRHPQARVLQRKFDTFQAQWNHALDAGAIHTDWVLALDADHVLTEELVQEIAALRPDPDVTAYRVRFRYCVDGSPLRGSLYPPSTILWRRDAARFVQDGHTQRIHIESGRVEPLVRHALHDDRKSLQRWLRSQERYAEEEAQKLSRHALSELSWPDRVRRVPLVAAPLVGAHCLLLKGCMLDGRPGLKYAAQRVIAELMLSLKLLERARTGRDIDRR